jgi:hypothetical protein
MRRLHPFTAGLIGCALIVYGLASVWDASSAGVVVPLPVVGALIGWLICRWRPGLDAPWWKLLPAAVLTNVAMLMALGELALQWRCLLDPGADAKCSLARLALWIVALCLLLPACGLLWRWRSRRAG